MKVTNQAPQLREGTHAYRGEYITFIKEGWFFEARIEGKANVVQSDTPEEALSIAKQLIDDDQADDEGMRCSCPDCQKS